MPGEALTLYCFFAELYAMVNEVDDSICEWHKDGKSFIIKDQKAFEKSVIPQFFKHSKIASFVRVSERMMLEWLGDVVMYVSIWCCSPASASVSFHHNPSN